MNTVLFFDQINEDYHALAGGKANSLHKMIRLGINIPNGFVVLSPVLNSFLEENHLSAFINTNLATLDYKDTLNVKEISNQIQEAILNSKISDSAIEAVIESFQKLDTKFVAVRSSAIDEDGVKNAWAGQLNSYMNVTKENLISSIRLCWTSLYNSRALSYRMYNKQMYNAFSMSVIVQKMVNSEKSGVAFSIHPITKNHNCIVIEACLGLGEALVSGTITPDYYLIDKQTGSIIERKISKQSKQLINSIEGGTEWVEDISTKQKVSDKQIKDIASKVVLLEEYYKIPIDVEWSIDKENVYILQCRPITNV